LTKDLYRVLSLHYKKFILSILLALILGKPEIPVVASVAKNYSQEVLSTKEISMAYRYPVASVSKIFNKQNGFKTDGYLYGDGVCQLV